MAMPMPMPMPPPPPNQPSNPVDNEGPTVTAVAIAFGVLTAIVISLRSWARIWLVKSFGADDALIVIAALFSWAFMVVIILAAQHGLGRHYADVIPLGRPNEQVYSFSIWLSSILYNACLSCIKLSVLALYMRLGDATLRRLAIGMIVIVGCQAVANVLASVFQCLPVRAAWDHLNIQPYEKHCIDIGAYYLANAAINIITDILVYTLPVRLVMRLQVPRRQKIGLAVMLCLGLLACISSIVRITFIPRIVANLDITWVYTGALYWSVIEINVGILAASIPSFKVIAKRYAPRLLGSGASYGSSAAKQSNNRRSGFHMMDGSGSAAESAGVDLRDLDASRKNRVGFDTRIERGPRLSANSSEEALYLPGQIGVKTQIVTYTSGSSGS
ncbi:Uu.00g020430.m01.CDS01 [Anthostomella pinea]|uniref:Uu.00g020430.m01.CDS01 n=1 Tax=Anthostomella pinea TaxID=933095 RepID=A0AAI8YQQ2_9PEZI|nr:Uu.00g020430.m01.CDS01 [Anthostomella pinea]